MTRFENNHLSLRGVHNGKPRTLEANSVVARGHNEMVLTPGAVEFVPLSRNQSPHWCERGCGGSRCHEVVPRATEVAASCLFGALGPPPYGGESLVRARQYRPDPQGHADTPARSEVAAASLRNVAEPGCRQSRNDRCVGRG